MHTIYNIQRNIEQKEVVFKEKYKKQKQKKRFSLIPRNKQRPAPREQEERMEA
jgi:hypothetical protein